MHINIKLKKKHKTPSVLGSVLSRHLLGETFPSIVPISPQSAPSQYIAYGVSVPRQSSFPLNGPAAG